MDALIIILTGAVVASSCGILGSFLILRRMAMLGDAISHAVLPGIVIAFLINGNRTSIWLMIGAAITGLLTAWLVEVFSKKTGLQEDASIGITFTTLFALGIILISVFTRQVDIDQDCVLFGELAFLPFKEMLEIGSLNLGPIAMWYSIALLIIISLLVYFGFKGFQITAFDPAYSKSLGIKNQMWHILLMSLVSLTTVVSFESVGAIMVVALLVAPAAIAYLITQDLKKMILLAVANGIFASFAGYFIADVIDSAISAAIVTSLGIQFVIVFALRNRFRKSEVVNS